MPSKFFKVYKAPGYPIDPKLEEERMYEVRLAARSLDNFLNKIKIPLYPWQKPIIKDAERLEKEFIERNIFLTN